MSERHEIWVLLDRIQMDVRALDTKVQALRGHVAGLDLPDKPAPSSAVEKIRRQIANGVITSQVDLDAEIRGANLGAVVAGEPGFALALHLTQTARREVMPNGRPQ